MEEIREEIDRRHDLALVEQLAREGRSQAEIEYVLKQRTDEQRGVREAFRRLLGAPTKKAA